MASAACSTRYDACKTMKFIHQVPVSVHFRTNSRLQMWGLPSVWDWSLENVKSRKWQQIPHSIKLPISWSWEGAGIKGCKFAQVSVWYFQEPVISLHLRVFLCTLVLEAGWYQTCDKDCYEMNHTCFKEFGSLCKLIRCGIHNPWLTPHSADGPQFPALQIPHSQSE